MKTRILALFIIALLTVASALPLLVSAKPDQAQLTILEIKAYGKPDGKPGGKPGGNTIPPEDNGLENPDYSLLRFHWYTTAEYWINTDNNYGFTVSQIVNVVQTSANTWDSETYADVFSYGGTTSRSAGTRDYYNVVSWGSYQAGVIAVTFIWSAGRRIVETDLRMNTYYAWSLDGEAGKMDVQNILTHEFGHWAGLNDRYKKADYWLTMYGYSDFGITYQQTLGLGDIKGLQAFYGP